MALQSVKISNASPLLKEELSVPVLIPVAKEGSSEPRSLAVSELSQSILEKVESSSKLVKVEDLDNYYTKQEVDDLIQHSDIGELTNRVDRLEGDVDTPGSIKFQINEAKNDLIGPEGDSSNHNTVNAAKSLVADSLDFIIYS